MGRSKRFRVSHVTSEGNRALARSDINSRMKSEENNAPPRKISPETSHELDIVIERNKSTAKCFECDFKVESNSGFLSILFDAEDHGRITHLDCPLEHRAVVLSWIRSIRKGWVTRDLT
jgi:hypothetical protein